MFLLIIIIKEQLELITKEAPRASFFMLGSLQTQKCMFNLKVNFVTN